MSQKQAPWWATWEDDITSTTTAFVGADEGAAPSSPPRERYLSSPSRPFGHGRHDSDSGFTGGFAAGPLSPGSPIATQMVFPASGRARTDSSGGPRPEAEGAGSNLIGDAVPACLEGWTVEERDILYVHSTCFFLVPLLFSFLLSLIWIHFVLALYLGMRIFLFTARASRSRDVSNHPKPLVYTKKVAHAGLLRFGTDTYSIHHNNSKYNPTATKGQLNPQHNRQKFNSVDSNCNSTILGLITLSFSFPFPPSFLFLFPKVIARVD